MQSERRRVSHDPKEIHGKACSQNTSAPTGGKTSRLDPDIYSGAGRVRKPHDKPSDGGGVIIRRGSLIAWVTRTPTCVASITLETGCTSIAKSCKEVM